MDLVKLSSATWVPEETLIEGYISLIWTERWQTPGEFELKSYDVEGMLARLPEGALVSHLETKEVMEVETHEINDEGEGADAIPVITIRGHSISSILHHRFINGGYQTKRTLRYPYTAASALAVLLVNAVDNTSGKDVTRGDTDPETELELNDYAWNLYDAIPNVAVTESVTNEGSTREWFVEPGLLGPQFHKIMVDSDLGLRIIRPVSPNNSGTVIGVQTTLATRGTVVRTHQTNISALRFDVYSGIDRSATVQFSQLQGHMEKPSYLKSNQDYKSNATLMSGVISGDVAITGTTTLSGLRRRVLPFDAGNPELPPEPERPQDPRKNATAAEKEEWKDDIDKWKTKHAKWKTKRAAIITKFRNEQILAAQREIRLHRRVNMFSGDVSALSPFKYKTHYDLGDKVTLVDEARRTAKMVVSEYVRTEDATGDRGFPGLVEP